MFTKLYFGVPKEILYVVCQVYFSSLNLCGNTKSVLSCLFHSKLKLQQPANNQEMERPLLYFHGYVARVIFNSVAWGDAQFTT